MDGRGCGWGAPRYVHRLIASSADGKLVELPGTDDAPADAERRTHAPEEKVRFLGALLQVGCYSRPP